MLATIPEAISQEHGELVIQWKDGRVCRYGLLSLRKQCPCANCRGGHSVDSVRTTDHITEIALVSWKKVGRYALSFTWSDHHDTGIYTYDRLRAACESNGDYE